MIATLFEIAFAALILIGILNREKLIAWEAPIKAAVAEWFRRSNNCRKDYCFQYL